MYLFNSLVRLAKPVLYSVFLLVLPLSLAQAAQPTISGDPSTTATVGSSYVFQPDARDRDGDTLRFKIRDCPDWASFDTRTGRLSGTPRSADVGTYRDVHIAVTDGGDNVKLPKFTIKVSSDDSGSTSGGTSTGGSASVSLSWTAPTRRADGSPLSLSELAGYTVRYGTSLGRYNNAIGVGDRSRTSLTITDLPSGTYYFVVTARDSSGMESSYSSAVSKRAR
jgi:hypothetical protein